MNALATIPSAPAVVLRDGVPTTTSLDVADYFHKQHKDVLRAVENLREELDEEHRRNFALMSIEVDIGNGATRKSPAYTLTRDGFTLLAMGFTGKRALSFKLAYIDAFNKMEAEIKAAPSPQLPNDGKKKHIGNGLKDSIREAVKEVITEYLPGGEASQTPDGLPFPSASTGQWENPPDFDVKKAMLDGLPEPTIPLPPEIEKAAKLHAVRLEYEAHALIFQHILRKIAYHCEVGKPRQIDEKRAWEVIHETTLGSALAQTYWKEANTAEFLLRYAAKNLTEAHQALYRRLSA